MRSPECVVEKASPVPLRPAALRRPEEGAAVVAAASVAAAVAAVWRRRGCCRCHRGCCLSLPPLPGVRLLLRRSLGCAVLRGAALLRAGLAPLAVAASATMPALALAFAPLNRRGRSIARRRCCRGRRGRRLRLRCCRDRLGGRRSCGIGCSGRASLAALAVPAPAAAASTTASTA